MTTVTVTATGAGSFTIPTGVTSIVLEGWGGGFPGSNLTSADQGGGGGGYIKKTFTVTAGQIVYYSVAAAQTDFTIGGDGTWFNLGTNSGNPTAGAYQASRPVTNTGGLTVNASGGTGNQGAADVRFNGGNSASAQGGGGSRGGSGGGGAAGPDSAGAAGIVGSGAAGGVGGASGWTGSGSTTAGTTGASDVRGGAGGGGGAGAGGAGGDGGAPGGGGGGGGSSSGASGIGARGQIQYTYTVAGGGGATPRSYGIII